MGAALFTFIALRQFPGVPERIVAQIITGIGFIGAGVIWKHENDLSGITTAATIWCAAAVGILIGVEMILMAFLCTILICVILKLKYLEA